MTDPTPPTDAEVMPPQRPELDLRVQSRAGEDPVILAEHAEETIMSVLHEAGEDWLVQRIREAHGFRRRHIDDGEG